MHAQVCTLVLGLLLHLHCRVLRCSLHGLRVLGGHKTSLLSTARHCRGLHLAESRDTNLHTGKPPNTQTYIHAAESQAQHQTYTKHPERCNISTCIPNSQIHILQTNSSTHTQTQRDTHTDAQTCRLAEAQMHARSRAEAQTNGRTDKETWRHRHTHTHTDANTSRQL